MSQGPFKLETKAGNVWLNVTSRDHIYVEFGHNLNVEREGAGSSDRRGPVTIRGIAYAGSMHAHRWKDGKFHLGDESQQEYQRVAYSLYLSRWNPTNYSQSEPSNAARKTAIEAIMPLVAAWAEAHPAVFEGAQAEHLEQEQKYRLEKIAKVKAELAELVEQLRKADRELAAIYAAAGKVSA